MLCVMGYEVIKMYHIIILDLNPLTQFFIWELTSLLNFKNYVPYKWERERSRLDQIL